MRPFLTFATGIGLSLLGYFTLPEFVADTVSGLALLVIGFALIDDATDSF
jgi:hypothetical protein